MFSEINQFIFCGFKYNLMKGGYVEKKCKNHCAYYNYNSIYFNNNQLQITFKINKKRGTFRI